MGSQTPAIKFPHRLNRDGTYDSICPACFRTIATAKHEFELLAYEVKHVCDMPFRPSKTIGFQ